MFIAAVPHRDLLLLFARLRSMFDINVLLERKMHRAAVRGRKGNAVQRSCTAQQHEHRAEVGKLKNRGDDLFDAKLRALQEKSDSCQRLWKVSNHNETSCSSDWLYVEHPCLLFSNFVVCVSVSHRERLMENHLVIY